MSDVDPLILHGLRFGGLLRVDDQDTVDRYNKALVAFGLEPVAQVPLHIDLCGFSLEVANALGDIHYLNPNQINPRFIIVSAKQEQAPLVHTSFSSTKKIVQSFFELNRSAIELITLRDALYGDIQNSTMHAHSIEDILDFPYVEFEIHTVNNLIEKSSELENKIKQFTQDSNAWCDIGLMKDIVSLSKQCGDVRKNPIRIIFRRFQHPDTFTTKLFGGATIIDGTVIGKRDVLKKATNGKTTILNIDDCSQILGWLDLHEKLESLDLKWLVSSGFIDHRLEMLAVEILADKLESFDPFIEGKYPEAIMQNHIRILTQNETFKEIERLRSLVMNRGIPEAEVYFWKMTSKSQAILRRAVPDQDFTNDVNRILGYYYPKDYLISFILDKPSFYEMFRGLKPIEQEFAAKLVQTRYMIAGKNSRQHRESVKKQFFGDKTSIQNGDENV